MKTFTRARAAKAALLKILDMHEVPAEVYIIHTVTGGGRFGAEIEFLATVGDMDMVAPLYADLYEAGFVVREAPAQEPAEVDQAEGMAMTVTPVEATPVMMGDAFDHLEETSVAVEQWMAAYREGTVTLEKFRMGVMLLAAAAMNSGALSYTESQAIIAEADDFLALNPPKEDTPVAVTANSGYRKEVSAVKGATKLVHAIAASMPDASRKDVLEACRVAGIAFGTARTQYQVWFKENKNT